MSYREPEGVLFNLWQCIITTLYVPKCCRQLPLHSLHARKTDNKHALLELFTFVAPQPAILISDEIDRVAS